MIQGEVRIWKKGTTHSPIKLTDWTDVLDQALHYPHVDWLIRTETSPSETIRIKYTWVNIIFKFPPALCVVIYSSDHQDLVPRIPSQRAATLSSNPLVPPLPTQTTPSSSTISAPASDAVRSPSRTRTKDMLERGGQVVTPIPPLAFVRSTQSRDKPDVPYAPCIEATSASVSVSILSHNIRRSPT